MSMVTKLSSDSSKSDGSPGKSQTSHAYILPDSTLIAHLGRQQQKETEAKVDYENVTEKEDPRTRDQDVNCCVIWARPDDTIIDIIQEIQGRLVELVGKGMDSVFLLYSKSYSLFSTFTFCSIFEYCPSTCFLWVALTVLECFINRNPYFLIMSPRKKCGSPLSRP